MRLRSSETLAGRRVEAARPGEHWRRLGDLLTLSPEQKARIAERQAQTGRLYGEIAQELGFATAEDVRRAVEMQQGFSVLQPDDTRIDPIVVAAFDPEDALAISARSVRGVITSAQRPDGAPVQTVAMVGIDPEASIESSVLAANVAVACAQAGHATMLVDGGIAQPRQHALFRVPGRQGLTTLLSSKGQATDVAQPTVVPLLSVIAAGPEVPNVPELFDRQRLATALEPLRDAVDLVIFDAPQGPHAKLDICLGLDAAIFVAKRHASDPRTLRAAVKLLRDGGVNVIGTILVE